MEQNEYQTNSRCACSSGCCGNTQSPPVPKAPYITGLHTTTAGAIPQVATKLSARDIIGTWKVRWGIGRMNYKISPGLYSVGKPDDNSPVLVTANYKLTFDCLRKELTSLHLWILVLDTKGVNVWCAAGKGTFGTDELVRRISAVRLSEIVRHRTLILPQLGATGIAAHEVAKKSGFQVIYGPVRAEDIKEFLNAGMKATQEMREVQFTFTDRIVLTPVDFIQWMKPLLVFYGIFFILNISGLGHFGITELFAVLGSVIAGCILTPAFLPWIPGRAFAFKGALMGLIWTVVLILLTGGASQTGILKTLSYLLVLPSVSAYTAMNFTGSSTYTSPSGVNKEMRIAIPIMFLTFICGMILFILSNVLKTIL
ncbi:CO dehydrogenase/acetyl-CoA synthase delta subunit [Anaerocolumna jejuensis DSM 15929]|uniref:CO dehydrogenase/acetyl-CoA synthase delta subunit n=1 Tax=Anaerocolumna jejuensis DSM 15929 TaxID=1121322 RepID=A0A1M6W1F7_9FIRM|nr:mercury methylation corrinoid protein HgcA [Anaerocolumna jejuensis]SHK87540.1 CO dehydrogenase/acetyl-CoA synthase delta subunit [Anaerocolumna jejuensis DSM 15929]